MPSPVSTPIYRYHRYPLVTTRSSYGHRLVFQSDRYDRCLMCGERYQVIPTPDSPYDFKWTTEDGSDPQECKGQPN